MNDILKALIALLIPLIVTVYLTALLAYAIRRMGDVVQNPMQIIGLGFFVLLIITSVLTFSLKRRMSW